jgi:hypothetical protein
MPVVQKPKAIAFLPCDQVIFEQRTRKPSVVGAFNLISADKFPARPLRVDVFVALSDGLGDVIIDVVVTRLADNKQLSAQSAEINFPDPLRMHHLRFRFQQLVFPSAGTYLFSLLADGEEISQYRVQVRQSEE